MRITQPTQDPANRLVRVECLLPFRLNDGNGTREVRGREYETVIVKDAEGKPVIGQDGKPVRQVTDKVVKHGEIIDIEFHAANALANHTPPKVGPATETGRKAQERAAA